MVSRAPDSQNGRKDLKICGIKGKKEQVATSIASTGLKCLVNLITFAQVRSARNFHIDIVMMMMMFMMMIIMLVKMMTTMMMI